MTAARADGQRGAALIVVIAVMLMILAICATTLEAVSREGRASLAGRQRLRAFYAAEAGFHMALSRVRTDGSLRTAAAVASAATISGSFGGGTYQTTAAVVGSGDLVMITSTATIGDARRSVEAVFDASFNQPITFRYAAHGGGYLDTDSGATFDSYVSTSGTPTASMLNGDIALQHADLSADGEYSIVSPSKARGYLHLGPEGSGTGNAKFGSVQLPEPQRMRRILRPDDATPSAGAMVLTGTATASIGPGTFVYDSITIRDAARLDVVGPATLIVDGRFLMQNDSLLYIDHGPGRRVSTYIADDGATTVLRAATAVAPPETCNIWFTRDMDCRIRSIYNGVLGGFYGTVYFYGDTRDHFLRVNSAVPLVGSIYCSGQGWLHSVFSSRVLYDEDLANHPIPVSSAPTYEIRRWRELP